MSILGEKLAHNSNAPRSQENYSTQISEEIEGKATQKLSQEFSTTESRILGALSRLDDFLLNPLLHGHSGTAPETSRSVYGTNQGTNQDNSQSDPHPEANISECQMRRRSGLEDAQDMLTGVHEEVTYWSTSTSSGKQKKNCSTIQPQFLSENFPATIEADPFLLGLQKLANNNKSAIIQNKTTDCPSCQSCSPQRCPLSTGNPKSLSCLKTFSKQVSKLTII